MFNDVRIYSITSTMTKQPIAKLIQDVLTSKTQVLPSNNILAISITPDADVTIEDIATADTLTVPADITKSFYVLNAHLKLLVKNAATVKVELYFGN